MQPSRSECCSTHATSFSEQGLDSTIDDRRMFFPQNHPWSHNHVHLPPRCLVYQGAVLYGLVEEMHLGRVSVGGEREVVELSAKDLSLVLKMTCQTICG